MKNLYIYSLFFLIISLFSCGIFETKIEPNRESFIKIYSKENNVYTGMSGDYIVDIEEGFLLGASVSPQSTPSLSTQIHVSHDGELLHKNDITNSIITYNKILPSTDDVEKIYALGAHSDASAQLIKMSLEDYQPIKEFNFGTSTQSLDFSVFAANGEDNVIALVQQSIDFDDIKLMLVLLDKDLELVWKRELSFEETALIGFSVVQEENTGHFIILGRDTDQQLFLVETNSNGNIINIRFFDEFGFAPIDIQQTSDNNIPIYNPVLFDMGTYYMVIETGRLYTKSDATLPFSSIFRVEKNLSNIQLISTNTNFASVSTVQKIDGEILINGFLEDKTFAIKRLDGEGNLKTWTNSDNEEFVTFDMDLATIEDGSFFSNSPALGDYDDFFIPGNIVKTNDGGYAMIGTYGIFNSEDFESVMTLFKFKGDGSY